MATFTPEHKFSCRPHHRRRTTVSAHRWQLAGPVGFGAVPLEESLCAVGLVFIFPSGQTPALASVHSLLHKAFSDPEVDLDGVHHGGCLDVDGSRQS